MIKVINESRIVIFKMNENNPFIIFQILTLIDSSNHHHHCCRRCSRVILIINLSVLKMCSDFRFQLKS